MSVTLVVENGSGSPTANTYIDLAGARALSEAMGLLPLPVDDDAATAALLQAMPYLEAQPWLGRRTTGTQALSWPRDGVIANGYEVANNVVPIGIANAQVQAASLIQNGSDLLPTIGSQFVIEETVGPITTKYSDAYWNGNSVFSSIDVYLKPYLNWIGGYRLSPAFGF